MSCIPAKQEDLREVEKEWKAEEGTVSITVRINQVNYKFSPKSMSTIKHLEMWDL